MGKSHAFSLLPLAELEREHETAGFVESAPRNPTPSRGVSAISKRARRSLRPSALQAKARSLRVPYMYLDRESRGRLTDFVAKLAPDVICVASLSQLLPPSVLNVPRHGAINLHPSLLPKYHGPFPWFWQYHDFKLDIGATVHVIDEGQDTGPILEQAPVRLELGMDIHDAMGLVARIGGTLMAKAVKALEKGTATPTRQPEHNYPKARVVERHERFIDWETWALERVWHFMRGTYPWVDPVEYPSELPGARAGDFERGYFDGVPGTLGRDDGGYYVIHREGRIRLLSPEEKKMKSQRRGA